MRTISNTIAFENLFNGVPGQGDPSLPEGAGSAILKAFSEKVLRPYVNILEDDCGTRLGSLTQTDSDVLGKVPLRDLTTGGTTNTTLIPEGAVITAQDLSSNNSILTYSQHQSVRLRTLSTCISQDSEGNNGVCSKCLRSDSDYDYKITMPKAVDAVEFGAGYLPSFWYLENLVPDSGLNIRQRFIVYYAADAFGLTPFEEKVASDLAFVKADLQRPSDLYRIRGRPDS